MDYWFWNWFSFRMVIFLVALACLQHLQTLCCTFEILDLGHVSEVRAYYPTAVNIYIYLNRPKMNRWNLTQLIPKFIVLGSSEAGVGGPWHKLPPPPWGSNFYNFSVKDLTISCLSLPPPVKIPGYAHWVRAQDYSVMQSDRNSSKKDTFNKPTTYEAHVYTSPD